MRLHRTKIVDFIEYQREDNIHAVQTFCGDENGRSLLYNPEDNEYYLDSILLARGDGIARDSNGGLRVLKPWRAKP